MSPTSFLRPLAPALIASFCAVAAAQPHQVSHDGYTLRGSTVVSTAISPDTAKEHGIERSASRGVLNVLVQSDKNSPGRNVAAEVHAVTRNLAGMEREIPMRAAKAPNGMVSYMGTYDFLPREVLDFVVTARPQDSNKKLTLEFRDRLPAVSR